MKDHECEIIKNKTAIIKEITIKAVTLIGWIAGRCGQNFNIIGLFDVSKLERWNGVTIRLKIV